MDCKFVERWLRNPRFEFRPHSFFPSIHAVCWFIDEIVCIIVFLMKNRFDRYMIYAFSSRFGPWPHLERTNTTNTLWMFIFSGDFPALVLFAVRFNLVSRFWIARTNHKLTRHLVRTAPFWLLHLLLQHCHCCHKLIR